MDFHLTFVSSMCTRSFGQRYHQYFRHSFRESCLHSTASSFSNNNNSSVQHVRDKRVVLCAPKPSRKSDDMITTFFHQIQARSTINQTSAPKAALVCTVLTAIALCFASMSTFSLLLEGRKSLMRAVRTRVPIRQTFLTIARVSRSIITFGLLFLITSFISLKSWRGKNGIHQHHTF